MPAELICSIGDQKSKIGGKGEYHIFVFTPEAKDLKPEIFLQEKNVSLFLLCQKHGFTIKP